MPMLAVAAPDAGSLQRQIENDTRRDAAPQALPELPPEPEKSAKKSPKKSPTKESAAPADVDKKADKKAAGKDNKKTRANDKKGQKKRSESLQVTVGSFRFTGNTLMSTRQLQLALKSFLQRPLDMTGLQSAAAAAAKAYRDAGYVARVVLPPQSLENGGEVELQVIEARLGAVRIVTEGKTSVPVSAERIRKTAEAAQAPGQPLDNKAVDRAILLVDDLPGVAAGGALVAGRQPGDSDVLLRVRAEPRWGGDAKVDNTGSRSTGNERFSLNLYWSSPSGEGDQITSTYLHTLGSEYLRLAYKRPLGYGGWMVGANASAMQYELVGAAFSAFQSEGDSQTVGLEASYPVVRGRARNLSLQIQPDFKRYHNMSAGIVTTQYQISTLNVGMNAILSDSFLAGGNWSLSGSLVGGIVDLSDSPNRSADALTTKTDGAFVKALASVTRQQSLTPRQTVKLKLSAQWAPQNLDSAEKFYIGGANAVRAYSSSDGGGSAGVLSALEWTQKWPAGVSSTLFYDWGHVTVNVQNNFPGAPAVNDYALQGGGAALGWQHRSGLNARATWAYRVGDNPNPDAKGNDQDGTLTMNRIWVEMGYAF
jgi:hemolysin activation/secretion protein